MDAYTNHLASVSESHAVIASEDICNSQGQLVIPKGQVIDAKASEKIVKFKLLRPIEQSISIENELDAQSLFHAILIFIQSNPHFTEIYEQQDIAEQIKACCSLLCQHDLLRQKLTVLSVQLPQIFDQGIFCAWFTVATAMYKQRKLNDIANHFIAAMCHDVGLLHIDPDIIQKKKPLSNEEWRQIQSHPIISHKILTSIKNLDKSIAIAVLEHHEHLDGTGYPRNLVSEQLDEFGQTLKLIESTYAIYRKHFKPRDRSLHDLIPIVQMNVFSSHKECTNELIIQLRKGTKSHNCSVPTDLIPELIDRVIELHDVIENFMEMTRSFMKSAGVRHNNSKVYALQNIALQIAVIMEQSGIINEAYMRWLDQVKGERLMHAYREVEDVFIMMQEVMYHIENFRRQTNILAETKLSTELSEPFESLKEAVNKIPENHHRGFLPNVMMQALSA